MFVYSLFLVINRFENVNRAYNLIGLHLYCANYSYCEFCFKLMLRIDMLQFHLTLQVGNA